jgi:hypothetical protein
MKKSELEEAYKEQPKRIRIKKDVFKNAEFGKAYKTREGRKAIFLKWQERDCLLLIQRDFGFAQLQVSQKGKHYPNNIWDIVSEWE